MALTEQRILKQVSVLPDQSAVNVQWADQILRDGELVTETLHRCAYTQADKDRFLMEVKDAALYLPIRGWCRNGVCAIGTPVSLDPWPLAAETGGVHLRPLSMSKIIVDLKRGETLTIGGASITLEQKSGQVARLVVVADASTQVIPPRKRLADHPGAQECASTEAGAHHHGKHAV